MTRSDYLEGVNLYLDWLEDPSNSPLADSLTAFYAWEKRFDDRETLEVRLTAQNIFQQIDN